MVDMKGIATYIAAVFGLLALALGSVQQFGLFFDYESTQPVEIFGGMAVFFGVMWLPAIAAWLARLLAPLPEADRPRVWPLKISRVILVVMGITGVFVLMYTIMTVLGVSRPDWGMNAIASQIKDSGGTELGAAVYIVFAALYTLLLGPTIFAGLCLGMELGWRGYLLPKLMPLGRLRAQVLTGLIWGVWMAPALWVMTPSRHWLMPAAAVTLAVGLGAVFGEIRLRTGSVGLSAVAGGCFAANASGFWIALFTDVAGNPWDGPFGVIAMATWLAAGAAMLFLPGGHGPLWAQPSPALERGPEAEETGAETEEKA